MTQLFTLKTSNICFIFLALFLIFLMLLFLILQVPTISLLVPILSTMVAPSSEELSCVPLLNVSALIVTTLHIQGHFIFRPTMFPLELQVVLLKPFLDFIHAGILLGTEQAPRADKDIDKKKSDDSYELTEAERKEKNRLRQVIRFYRSYPCFH